MDEFDNAPRPTIISSISFNGVNYVAGMERDLAHSELPVADFKRLTAIGVIAGFEKHIARLESGEAATAEETEEEIELPPISKLAEFLEGYDDVDEIRSIQEQDKRKSAQEVYEARIAELEG